MEASALKHPGAVGLHARSPLLRLQSDERLVALVRRGNPHAFEALVARYQSRLQAFCRHMLATREDAEDVLQEVFAAAYNAMIADERPINVRPWLYRIARNRSLNHLRKATAIGMDSMDVHLAEHGKTTAEHVQGREELRQLVADVQELPESQRTALLLREIDALSYDQIAEVMETTIPSVKSLLVRARVSLAEMAEARMLTCAQVRMELGEVAEGLTRTSAPVRRHLRTCDRCQLFRRQLKDTNKALAALMPLGPMLLLKKFLIANLGGGGAAAAGGGAAAAGGGAAAAGAGLAQAGIGAIAGKAAAGLAAAAIVTAGAVEVRHVTHKPVTSPAAEPVAVAQVAPPVAVQSQPQDVEGVTTRTAAAETPGGRPAKAADDPDAAATPEAAPTPAATPAPADGGVQHDGDTTTLQTDYAGSAQPGNGTAGGGGAPTTTATGPSEPQPQSSEEPPPQEPGSPPSQTADEPTVAIAPEPTPQPTPEPAPGPRPGDGTPPAE